MNIPSPVEPLKYPLFSQHNIQVDIKRDDLIHETISGNKWRKLKYLLEDAKVKKCETLVSMGGNYSNHLHALAFAAKEHGFKAIGFVRAHAEQELTPTLQDCLDWGMELKFVTRSQYSELRQLQGFASWQKQISGSYWMGEGGFSQLAIKGVREIAQEVDEQYDFVFTATGSGATLVGLAQGFKNSKVIGVAAFKGASYLQEELANYLLGYDNWQLDLEHHCGGFAKINRQLMEIKAEFEGLNGYKLDRIYNAKMLYALHDFIADGKIPSGSKVLLINTGGLQGDRT